MFKRIYFFYLIYLCVTGYAQTLFFLWFQQHGVSYLGMLFVAVCNYAGAILVFFLLEGRTVTNRISLRLGITASASAVFVASIMTHPWHAYIAGTLFAGSGVFFWTIYNTMYFKYSVREEHGYKSGLYFLFFPLSGAVTAPLAGFVAEKLGYHFLFTSALALYLVPFMLVFVLPSFDFKFKTKEAVSKIENKALIFFQGYNGLLGMTLIPIFTLFFITTPLKLGNFFGYLAILAALVAVFNSKISDKLKKRTSFFYFFTILNTLSYLPIIFISTLTGWRIFAGINNITSNLSNPFDIALILDHAKLDTEGTMLAREIYLNAGRVCMLLLALLILWLTHSFIAVLLVSSLTAILYPLVAYYQKVYLK